MVITEDTEYMGFLLGKDIVEAGKIVEILEKVKNDKNAFMGGYTRKYITEEIVIRGGEFLTAAEAKPIAPFNVLYDDVFFAKFKFLPDEERPVNPDYAVYNWTTINDVQYEYGKYLQGAIADGTISIKPEEIYDI